MATNQKPEMNVLSLNFDKKTNQAIGGTYNGGAIEEYYTVDAEGNTTPLPKHICELIDFLNSK